MTNDRNSRLYNDPLLMDAATTAQVVACLAMQSPTRSLDARMAPTLVYLADRIHCETRGHPMVRADRQSTPYGPVDATVAALVMMTKVPEAATDAQIEWVRLLENYGNEIVLRPEVRDEDLDMLSVAIEASIRSAWEQFGTMSNTEFLEWAEDGDRLPEWKRGIDDEITLVDVFEGTGMTRNMAESCAREDETMRGVTMMLHGYPTE